MTTEAIIWRLGFVGAVIVWICIALSIYDWALIDLFFWLSLAAFSTMIAASQFWGRRSIFPFWRGIAALSAVNLALIIPFLPRLPQLGSLSKGELQLIGVGHCALCWLALLGLFYPTNRQLPWKKPEP